MPSVTVLPGNHVEHDGKPYEAGEVISDITEKQAQALVNAGVVGNGEQTGQPSEEEVAAAAAAAGQTTEQTPEQKKGLFR